MAWVEYATGTITGAVLVAERGDGQDGNFGHRLKVDGVAGTVRPITEVATNGLYRAVAAEYELQRQPSDRSFGAAAGQVFKITFP